MKASWIALGLLALLVAAALVEFGEATAWWKKSKKSSKKGKKTSHLKAIAKKLSKFIKDIKSKSKSKKTTGGKSGGGKKSSKNCHPTDPPPAPPADCLEESIQILYGQHNDAGIATFSINSDGVIRVEIQLVGSLKLKEVHIYVGATPPTTNAPGQFPIKFGYLNTNYWAKDLHYASECQKDVYIAVHLSLDNGETAWVIPDNGPSTKFDQGWGVYFHRKVCCDCPNEVVERLGSECHVTEAHNDLECKWNLASGGFAFWIPQISTKLTFKDDSGSLVFHPEKNLHVLSGTLVGEGVVSGESWEFEVLIYFDKRQNETGVIKKELKDECYAENGGAIDTNDWVFYDFFGFMRSVGSNWQGGVLKVERGSLPLAEFGKGASQKNQKLGLSAWLKLSTYFDPDSNSPRDFGFSADPFTHDGDINVNYKCPCESPEPVFECIPGRADNNLACKFNSAFSGGHVFVFLGFGADPINLQRLVFETDTEGVSLGEYIEYEDGSARLTGPTVSKQDPTIRFELDVFMSNRINEIDEAKIKVEWDTSKQECVDQFNANKDDWYFFSNLHGTLTAQPGSKFDGLVLEMFRYIAHPYAQIGRGYANNKNENFGLATWGNLKQCDASTTADGFPTDFIFPNDGSPADAAGTNFQDSDINIDLVCEQLEP